jgi:hypothetical protein
MHFFAHHEYNLLIFTEGNISTEVAGINKTYIMTITFFLIVPMVFQIVKQNEQNLSKNLSYVFIS